MTEALIELPRVTFFVGYLDERPVCSAALIFTGDVAGIYRVGTLAPRRHAYLRFKPRLVLLARGPTRFDWGSARPATGPKGK